MRSPSRNRRDRRWPCGSSPPRSRHAAAKAASGRDELTAAVLRLSVSAPELRQPPLAAQLIAEAVEGGAGLGPEARIWAAIELLGASGQRAAAPDLAGQAAAALEEHAATLGRRGTGGGYCWPSTPAARGTPA